VEYAPSEIAVIETDGEINIREIVAVGQSVSSGHCGTEDLAQQPESILDTRHTQAVSFRRRYPGTHSSAELSMR
jgi:hypothetical protein